MMKNFEKVDIKTYTQKQDRTAFDESDSDEEPLSGLGQLKKKEIPYNDSEIIMAKQFGQSGFMD